MGEFVAAILELLAEFLLEIAMEETIAAISRSSRKRRTSAGRRRLRSEGPLNPVFAAAFYFALGFAIGGASLFLFPHPLFHPSRFHGISLLVSPVLTGMAMSLIGLMIRRKGREPVRIESFGYGFAFALGMAIVRLVFAR